MKKALISLLILSIVLVNIAYISGGRFLGLYYILWLGIVGRYIWKNRISLEERLVNWKVKGFKRFILLGVFMILFEEIFAGFSMNLNFHHTFLSFPVTILHYWALNLFALPGFMIGWYLLLRRYVYTRKEVFVLVGLFGLYSEKIHTYVATFPLMAILLILPTMATYMVIIAPSVMSFRESGTKVLPKYIKYPLGLIVPFVVSIPFIGILFILLEHFPWMFPIEFMS